MKNSKLSYELPLKVFYYRVSVHHKYRSSDPDIELEWTDSYFQRFMRWKWYFNYRAALLQVQNPRSFVIVKSGSYEPKTELEEKKALYTRLKNRLINNKGRITQWKNKIESYRSEIEDFKNNWNNLFPVEDDPGYQVYIENLNNAQRKLFRKTAELELLKTEMKELEEEILCTQ